ncbi:unnamed protein product [Closterium sp. NIES-54]
MAAAKRVLRYLCSTLGMGLVLGGRSPVVLTGHADASWADDQATQRSSQGYTFSLGSGSVSWRATRSSSVLGSSCEAEIYAGAMAAQELRWLTYLLTDLGEPPRSPPVLYVDNKAMLALCREQRLEHRTKHIALRYFLARELQQRGQLRLAYVASKANTADVFTKALAPCDRQRFCTQLVNHSLFQFSQLRRSTTPQRVPLPSPPASSLPDSLDPESDSLRAASPTVTRFLATAVSALVAELVDFAAACRLDYAASLAAMDAEMASWKSTGTYVDEVPPPGANIVSGMWIFRVKRPPGSPPAFKARYVARGFTFLQGSLHEEIWLRRPRGFTGSFPAGTQWSLRRLVHGLRQAPREWHDTLRTTLAALGFAPSTSDPSLFLRTDATLPPFYVLVYVDDLVFAIADTEALAHVHRPGAQRTITLTQSHMVQQVLLRFGFTYSSPQSTPLPTGHLLSAPPLDESVEPSGPYPELVGCLITSGMGLVLGGWARVVLTGHADASWVDDLATQRSSQGYTFSLGSGPVSWRSTCSSSVLSSSCEAEIYAGAMAAQELRWLTYLLTDLGEQPRSPPVLYVDNKAMLALCQEHRLEHRTKHIALRYFLARELQQRGQLRLAYVASQANTADVFTKALQPCDHQRFCTVLGLVPTVPHLLTS